LVSDFRSKMLLVLYNCAACHTLRLVRRLEIFDGLNARLE